jgi:hypothetical protein
MEELAQALRLLGLKRKYTYSKRLGRTFCCPAVRAVCAPFAVPGIVGEFNGASCATRREKVVCDTHMGTVLGEEVRYEHRV